MPLDHALPVVVIGAGLAGLTCARTLHRAGVPVIVLEASDGVGGRARTDELDGFRLDRGFQVFLTAYPEAAQALDYKALDFRPFLPGAAVAFQGRMHTLLDPWRKPSAILDGALAKVGSLADKLRVGSMRSRLQKATVEEIFARPERPILTALQAEGFSDTMIARFFRPFFGGIFFDLSLGSSSRMMEFVFRMFSMGDAAVPRLGMGRIADQIAAGLPDGVLRLHSRVLGIEPGVVRLASPAGEVDLPCSAIVNAAPTDDRLAATGTAPNSGPAPRPRTWRTVTTVYFAGHGVPPAPLDQPLLLLDGEIPPTADAPLRTANVVCMSSVSEAYAPPGRHLIAASVIGRGGADPGEPHVAVRAQLRTWFGPIADSWTHLRTYRIDRALPDQTPPCYTLGTQPQLPLKLANGLYRAGDLFATASIDGAMRTGRLAAEALLADR
ncbi:MAG: FAD-dependent oxidoreductase [Planctomycetaceae bacterium]|jgi:phytoene dehydrogenase-like protein|nr:FAD-dependent oxidoreductase [Planctomycetaceae bacterium]